VWIRLIKSQTSVPEEIVVSGDDAIGASSGVANSVRELVADAADEGGLRSRADHEPARRLGKMPRQLTVRFVPSMRGQGRSDRRQFR
jgi:hypothetical protein